MSIQLRFLTEPDLPLVRAWMRDAPESPAWSEEDIKGLVLAAAQRSDERRLRHAWIAEDAEGMPAGFAVAAAVRVPGAAAECELEFVYVQPSARRAGVGRALLEEVRRWARGLPARDVWLEVRASNVRAIALYARCGFAVTGRRPKYYVDPSEDAVLMRCGIDHDLEDAPV